MAFVKISKSAVGARNLSVAELRMGSHLHTGQETGIPRGIYISMTPALVRQVGWAVEEVASQRTNKTGETYVRAICRITIHEGIGEDRGFLMLVEDENGYSLGTTRSVNTSYNTNIAAQALSHYVLNEVPVPPALVQFTVDEKEKTILVECPDWLRYNPLSVPASDTADTGTNKGKAVASHGQEVVVDLPGRIPTNRKERRQAGAVIARALHR